MRARQESEFAQIDSPEAIETCLNCELGRCMENSIYCPLKSEKNREILKKKKEWQKAAAAEFTSKQQEVAAAIKAGMYYEEIRQILHVGSGTISKVRRALREKGEIE